MKKYCQLFSFLIFFFFIFSSPTWAKKVLPRFRGATVNTKATTGLKGVTATVKFTNYRRAIAVTFSNLKIATKVEYFLSYDTKGTTQGVSGSIVDLSESAVSRELLFGSCSKGVCRYDTGIKNAKFVVTTYLPGGKKVIKTFRLKV